MTMRGAGADQAPSGGRERDLVLAAWVLLLWIALSGPPGGPAPAADCPRPTTVATQAGSPVRVRCDGAPGASRRPSGPAALLFGERLDLNRATAHELGALPGIGPGRAGAIVAERARRRFDGVSDLERVRGIGPRTREAVEGLVRVQPER